MPEDNIMKYENTLPQDFDGVFKFSNPSDAEFVGVWGKKEYHFPANSTSPMIIPEHSPLEIQHIRKKFAKDLAEREFFKSQKYEQFRKPEGELGNRTMSGIHTASTYTMDDLTPYIQTCLKPLEPTRAFISQSTTRDTMSELKMNEDGELVTGAIKTDKDLESLAKGTLAQKAGIK